MEPNPNLAIEEWTYTEHSGSLIEARFQEVAFGNLEGIWIRRVGDKPREYNPRVFSCRRRSIYGSLIFRDDIYPEILYKIHDDAGPYVRYVSGRMKEEERKRLEEERRKTIPPFTVQIGYEGTYGFSKVLTLFGVECIRDGGQKCSIVRAGEPVTFVAMDLFLEKEG